jgi:NAD(P)H-hydrate epimerase
VIDADGLDAFDDLAQLAELRRDAGGLVLTPHPGELARLLGISASEVQRDRLATVRDAAQRSQAVVVLKGHHSLICEPGGTTWINPTGNSGLATGGTGDVLTGVLGAFLAQGLAPHDAAAAAVWVHGASGDRAAEAQGKQGLIAGDVVQALGPVLRDLAGSNAAPARKL